MTGWMYEIHGNRLHVGSVEVLKLGDKTARVSPNRFSGHRKVVPRELVFASRAECCEDARKQAEKYASKLCAQANELLACLAAAEESSSDFDGWSWRYR